MKTYNVTLNSSGRATVNVVGNFISLLSVPDINRRYSICATGLSGQTIVDVDILVSGRIAGLPEKFNQIVIENSSCANKQVKLIAGFGVYEETPIKDMIKHELNQINDSVRALDIEGVKESLVLLTGAVRGLENDSVIGAIDIVTERIEEVEASINGLDIQGIKDAINNHQCGGNSGDSGSIPNLGENLLVGGDPVSGDIPFLITSSEYFCDPVVKDGMISAEIVQPTGNVFVYIKGTGLLTTDKKYRFYMTYKVNPEMKGAYLTSSYFKTLENKEVSDIQLDSTEFVEITKDVICTASNTSRFDIHLDGKVGNEIIIKSIGIKEII